MGNTKLYSFLVVLVLRGHKTYKECHINLLILVIQLKKNLFSWQYKDRHACIFTLTCIKDLYVICTSSLIHIFKFLPSKARVRKLFNLCWETIYIKNQLRSLLIFKHLSSTTNNFREKKHSAIEINFFKNVSFFCDNRDVYLTEIESTIKMAKGNNCTILDSRCRHHLLLSTQ